MTDRWLFVITFATTLGCGVVGGVFFAFSTFVMKGLSRVSPAQGMAAMQSINIAAISPAFMTALFGTAAACGVLAASAIVTWQSPQSIYLVAGALLYLAGNVLVTMIFNVPRNNALAGADPNTADGARLWARYLVSWTAWNHVRTATAVAAAAVLMLALQAMRGA